MDRTRYIVVMLGDLTGCACGCQEQVLVLACRNAWTTREGAQKYADSCSPSRHASVVECPRGVDFRDPDEKCPRCDGTGWAPCLEPEGPFLRVVPGIKERCNCAAGKAL